MGTKSFGQYLVENGLISEEDHKVALDIQNKNRLLGEIAIELNYISRDDLPMIMEFIEKNNNIQFGEAAVSIGLINANQLRYLLDIRTRRKIKIGDILVEKGFIEKDTLRKAVMEFHHQKKKLEKVLVVETSPTVSRILENMLKKYGYTVFKVATGEEAKAIIPEVRPDIVMTGGILDDMTGLGLCYNVIADPRLSGLDFVLLSSNDSKEYIEQAFEIGVTHFLKIPLTEDELINVVYQVERERAEKRPETILTIDDNKGPRMVIYKELTRAGFNVFLAENGRDGVMQAKKIKPDIITMDLEMPIMDGFEACRALRESPDTADIPVIIISSHDNAKTREMGFEVGAMEFFVKPFKVGRLAEYVNMLLETRKIEKNESILVAEDSPITRSIFKQIFQKNGYKVYVVKNGEEALKALPSIKPDLVITDCYMPVKDGFEFTMEMKRNEEFRHIPVIMVTAAGSREDALKGLAAGANDYILKPFDEAELVARAGAHLANKKLFDEMEREKKKLEEMNRLKNQFLGIAAHDLRNPISSIEGFATYLMDKNYEGDREMIASVIKEAAGGALNLLNNLLDISTIEEGTVQLNLEQVDISGLIRERIVIFEIIANKKEIAINFERSSPTEIECDRLKVTQAIDNLLSNAIKFSMPKKNITVAVKDNSHMVKVDVADEGLGIPEDEMEELFRGGHTVSVRPTAGEVSTGYGLLITSKIIKAHGGKISATSKQGEGSTFSFTLPKE